MKLGSSLLPAALPCPGPKGGCVASSDSPPDTPEQFAPSPFPFTPCQVVHCYWLGFENKQDEFITLQPNLGKCLKLMPLLPPANKLRTRN